MSKKVKISDLKLDESFIKNEEWREIEGHQNYMVSNLGRVKSIDRIVDHGNNLVKLKGVILKPAKDNRGYLRVALSTNKRLITCKVHRLVALAFIHNPENKETVNHINEIKEDNRVENLEWATVLENNRHGTRVERAINNSIETGKSFSVLQKDSEGNIIKIWGSTREVERVLNIPNQSISRCCNGGRKTVRGFKWEYIKTA